ncbi:hypothetical protein METBIDRAFT_78827 [Metschnikowia bicuspidata var. bicuspidata NRRL YB-4993]|uniref:Pre-mRNA-splicing factor SYF1 n=1 Tax=Metschnikowia bicuspidata var. bicuspidata NRRL YB-4993 TaxID=869754 RepID=A0A1A0H983_9ASCO|nr:hypothetical protein METBIDRAFT_78827 [Metschnikowia bicuspidata var. bicuspidata NRRL YB-4993]OBA20447.1 hypothetical protein METBIDRAFT_78827 [Metschnikowia bicuspidata var. bicuspidata NRRL YB-4993]
MLLETLISQSQLPYEESLLENSDNETLWLEYFEAYRADFNKAVFILDRAVCELPHSTLLWNAYLQLPWSPEATGTLLGLYERVLQMMPSTPAFWLRYIDLLSGPNADAGRLRKALDMALFNLDRSHHPHIWQKYLRLAEQMSGPPAASIYARYFEISRGEAGGLALILSEQCVLKVAEHAGFRRAAALLRDLERTKPAGLRLHADFVLEFLCIVLQNTQFRNDAFVEQTAQTAAADFPPFAKRFMLVLASYFSARGLWEQARHFHALAFETAKTPADVVDVFDTVTNWEENQMERLFRAGDAEALRLCMRSFSRVLAKQPVLVNDVLIKAHPHNIDHWLERASIFQEKADQREVINTYVTAIRRVNPLQASSRNGHTMAQIWTQYADIYISQNDLSTANVVFSHAVKSQFRTVTELADLYIAWTEMIFTVSDDEALKHIELVLFDPQDETTPDQHKQKVGNTVHDQIAHSGHLWAFYIDVLKSMIEEGEDNLAVLSKLDQAYSRLFKLQIISLRLLLEYADFTATHENMEKSYAIYEAGIHNFRSPQAQFHIWAVYLDKIAVHVEDSNAIRDLFDRCVSSEIPGFHAYEIFEKYITFEQKQGNLVRSVAIMRDAINYLTRSFSFPRYTKDNRNKIADDKFTLYKKASHAVRFNLHDSQLYREIMTQALQDSQLTLPYGIELGLEFVEFEKSENELERVRTLFKYLAGLGHPDGHVTKIVWTKWEEWEMQSGTETSYKGLLETRRQLKNEYRDVSEAKADINPMGFVIAETKNASEKTEPVVTANPNAIELDMDM